MKPQLLRLGLTHDFYGIMDDTYRWWRPPMSLPT